MKRSLLLLFIFCGLLTRAQVYNNEWIDYNKTYYKFKIAANGVYRISQPSLASIGLGSTPAQHFQLWRNGEQVPLFTSTASGALSTTDYIEFWGEMNDGKADQALYREADFQLNDKWSLQTDTATYFLTVNPTGNNLRLVTTANNIGAPGLTAEPYFMHTAGTYYRDKINPGNAVSVGELLYSSSYDKGEGFTSGDIGANATLTTTLSNLFVYTAGPNATFKYNAAGNAIYFRRVGVKINGTSIDTMQQLDFFNYVKASYSIPVALLSSNSASIDFTNITSYGSDRIVIAQHELIYPRQFNFGGQKNFQFELPANSAGNYLEISGFNYGSTAPVLYDLTNGKRYVADISSGTLVKIVLQPSLVNRKLVLVNQESSNISAVTSINIRNFINYSSAANQGDYLIISNPLLYNGANGSNPVEDYRAYRASAAGGGHVAKIYDVDQLIDQFAFGIKKNPLGIRNFVLFAEAKFSLAPRFVFLIGKAVTYNQYRGSESNADIEKLNLVPTFGQPASDNLLTADRGSSQPKVPVGRLSAITGDEVASYLKKMKEYEQTQASSSPIIANKAWMKNIVHIIGSGEGGLQAILQTYMSKYKEMIEDTLFGAKVYTFSKGTADGGQHLNTNDLQNLFTEGISMITYFGHSSSSTLDFNLDDPHRYNNPGKYPVFFALGCNAGNFYNFNPVRFQTRETLSEKFVLEPDRGSIAFIASSHFGVVHYLDIYNTKNYNSIGRVSYGKTLGENMVETVKEIFDLTSENDFYARVHAEETILHGDPALKVNTHAKPDYAIEDAMLKISPSFISVAETSFTVNANFINLGRAIDRNIAVEVKRQYPDQTTEIIYKDTIPGIRYMDSISLTIPVNAIRDKGSNKLTVTIDADNAVDELYENNNSITKEFFIYEDEVRAIYPYNYAIVNKQNIKLVASTANAFAEMRSYIMEMDTTELFNSPLKIAKETNSTGGVIEFNPAITLKDSTVYYWRVSPSVQNAESKWNVSSFIYINGSSQGFSQAHLFQHFKSKLERIALDSVTRQWKFGQVRSNVFARNGVYPNTSSQGTYYTGTINDQGGFIGPGCTYDELIFTVIDPITSKAWKNDYSGSTGLYQSYRATCGSGREYNFEYLLGDATWRKRAMDFIDAIPDGYFVLVRTNTNPNTAGNTYSSVWKTDESLWGAGNSLYHKLFNQGFTDIDSFYFPRSYIFFFKKNGQNSFSSELVMSQGNSDGITLSANYFSSDTLGFVSSPVLGPAKAWHNLKWSGSSDNPADDMATLDVIGMDDAGTETLLFNNISAMDLDISSIQSDQYPYLKLLLRTEDRSTLTPYQLRYWMVTYTPVPEGAVAPNIFLQMKDTLEVGEPLQFKMAFKNISDTPFDSLKVKMTVTDRNNNPIILPLPKLKPLQQGDTLHVAYPIDTRNLAGLNTLYVTVNPDNDQPEQYLFNNFIYKNFYVKPDSLSPLMDITFDGEHILNRDIVSSKPNIIIKLKDEAKWRILNDTSLVNVSVRYPNGKVRDFNFVNDTLRFNAAGQAPNNDNTATVDFNPYFSEDGEYELVVNAKDMSNNMAGKMEYKITFQVINKPMISNMLNYPNPFTTSTAFVFTVTGSEVPQNIKIQIMTVTGKIVREITKDELGPLHIGRNITDFKWNGTDQYGQKLANGIYLYRVVTNLNGKSLDKYKADNDKTDQFFNKGYGKMYLMR